MIEDDFRVINSKDPQFHDPQFQRRIVAVHRPIAFIENMHDVTLECGHAPLVFVTPDPKVGEMCHCPDCYAMDERAK
jgi:hypothetical protein